MQVESIPESAETLKNQVPGLADVALDLATILKQARLFLDKLFNICIQRECEIDLTPEEQNSISMKVALVVNPEIAMQYARLVQLVFQLNYYSMCFHKALHAKIPKQLLEETRIILKEVERFRILIEKEYLEHDQ